MSKASKSLAQHLGVHHPRGTGVIREREHDPYRSDHHLPEGTTCSSCGATIIRGRWIWPVAHGGAAPTEDGLAGSSGERFTPKPAARSSRATDRTGDAFSNRAAAEHIHHRGMQPDVRGRAHQCPACERLAVGDAAGVLIIEAGLWSSHPASELQSVIEREAKAEAALHPMERIMSMEVTDSGDTCIRTTGLHTLRRVAHALEHLTHGQLRTRYAQGQHKVLMQLDAKE